MGVEQEMIYVYEICLKTNMPMKCEKKKQKTLGIVWIWWDQKGYKLTTK